MRLTQALRHMYLPGIGKEVHPFIQALRTQEDQARVIQYIFKKYSKIRGGELRKDTFVHGDEDDLVGRVLRGEVSTAPKPSSARQIFENNELQIRQGNYTRLPSYFFFMNKRRCTEYTDFFAMQTPIPPRSHCRFVFLHGAPGTGKTSLALDFAKHVAQGDGLAHYLKPHSKGWDGYRGQKVVIMDEAEPRCWKDLESLVKVWGDRYPFIAEVKGSSKPICPEWFVVTSNYTLPQLTDAVNRPSFFSAMKRRAEDGRRVISMETLGEYRPKRMGPQLKEYEEVFQLFVKLVQGEFSVCCIMFLTKPSCCRLR